MEFFPIQFFRHISSSRIRLQCPLPSYPYSFPPLSSDWILETTFHVLNPRIGPPLPRGCSLFHVFQNTAAPFETLSILYESTYFHHLSSEESQNGDFYFFAFVYPIPHTTEWHFRPYWPIQNSVELSPNQTSQWIIAISSSEYQEMDIHFFAWEHDYPTHWTSTSESLCIPSYEKSFPSLVECQNKTYPLLMNRSSWIQHSGRPLSEFISMSFPLFNSFPLFMTLLFFAILVLSLVLCVVVIKYK